MNIFVLIMAVFIPNITVFVKEEKTYVFALNRT